MAKVKFGIIWSVYGKQTVDLPDDIDKNDIEAVKKYIQSIWADVPLPEGDYISGSDTLDYDGEFVIIEESEV